MTFAARSLLVLAFAIAPAAAQTKLDISMPWGPTEFHVQNAQKFAERVKDATKGQVTMTVHAGQIELRAGAGIVADSDPEFELNETRAKARGLLRALGSAA